MSIQLAVHFTVFFVTANVDLIVKKSLLMLIDEGP